MLVIVLLIVALAAALWEEWNANGKSLLGWSVVLLAVVGLIEAGGIKL